MILKSFNDLKWSKKKSDRFCESIQSIHIYIYIFRLYSAIREKLNKNQKNIEII